MRDKGQTSKRSVELQLSSPPSGIEQADMPTDGSPQVGNGLWNDDRRSEEVRDAESQNRQPDEDAEMNGGAQ